VKGQSIRTVRITSPHLLIRERARNGTGEGATDEEPAERHSAG